MIQICIFYFILFFFVIKNLDRNVFETLKNVFLEEQENNKRKYEELSDHLDKMKTYFDEKINSLKNNTHENFEELKYYLDNLNKKNKDTISESNTFQENIDAIQNDISKLKKDKEENTNLIKSSIRTYFDKMKNVKYIYMFPYILFFFFFKVCEICGAMQAVGDMVQRFENHINGKQHLGFDKIRNTFNKLKEEIKEREEIIEEYRKTRHHSSDKRHSKRDRHHHRDYYERRSSRHKKSSERYHRNHHSNKRSRKRSHSDRSKSSSVHHSNKKSRKRSHSDRSKSSSVHNSNDRHKRRSVKYDIEDN
ncbi:hypothetical protein PFFCH_04482 [Plasmodium falciparum FCH/4]|uniref:Uncharacterized protein n=1 Tax=Plasmodium falciparum FCH/4 TaxID=1036724 RepID=A0A024VJP6_PLAFA|nr:hypothetical protein PFFCH_04482 [Plasmodium falciparum FCH/4]